MILEKINSELYWVIIAVLFLNLTQRKHHPHVDKKRSATLFVAVLVLLFNMFVAMILQFELPEWTAIPALLIVVVVGYLLRRKIAIFRLRCERCSQRLSFNSIMYRDDNLCDTCHKEEHPELYVEEKEEEPELSPQELNEHYAQATDVNQIDWEIWEPTERAVICYTFSEDKVLLINKKTGLGNGLVNAPGGRIEEDETAAEAAVRECQEETGITPLGISQRGILNFQFTDGYSLKGYVFFAHDHSGTLTETEEADPFWVPVEQIPYEKMWEDDALWLPKALEGSFVEGFFIFDDRKMVSSSLSISSFKEDH